jgi:hypothetical protein
MNTSVGFRPADFDAGGASWTSREIAQQPALWEEVGTEVVSRRQEVDAFLAPLLARSDLRVLLTGAGTSSFAGEILAPALTRGLGRRVDVAPTTDVVANPRECFAENAPTLLVSFARSGDSPESVATTVLAERCLSECLHLVVTCNREGHLFRTHSDAARSLVLLMPEAANDQGFAMTSSFTCMLLATLQTLGNAPSEELPGRLAAAARTTLSSLGGTVRETVGRARPRRLPRQRALEGPGPGVGAQTARAHGWRDHLAVRFVAWLSSRAEGDPQRAHAHAHLPVKRPLHPPVRHRHAAGAAHRPAARQRRGDQFPGRLPSRGRRLAHPGARRRRRRGAGPALSG